MRLSVGLSVWGEIIVNIVNIVKKERASVCRFVRLGRNKDAEMIKRVFNFFSSVDIASQERNSVMSFASKKQLCDAIICTEYFLLYMLICLWGVVRKRT